jgi:hypothetical protein
MPDKDSDAGLDDPQHFVGAARVVDFPYFAEAAGLVDLLYFAEAVEHLHLELVGYCQQH